MNASTTPKTIMVGDLDDAAVFESLVTVISELVTEECNSQGAPMSVAERVAADYVSSAASHLADVREELGGSASIDDVVAEALFRSRLSADDVLARNIAGDFRYEKVSARMSPDFHRFVARHGGMAALESAPTVFAQFGSLSPSARAMALTFAWTQGKPIHLSWAKWRSMFERTGFLYDHAPSERPDSVPTLYRAALPGSEKNWSWTDSLAIARWFGKKLSGSDIYVLEGLDAQHVLARFDCLGENEWVVDVAAAGASPVRLAA